MRPPIDRFGEGLLPDGLLRCGREVEPLGLRRGRVVSLQGPEERRARARAFPLVPSVELPAELSGGKARGEVGWGSVEGG